MARDYYINFLTLTMFLEEQLLSLTSMGLSTTHGDRHRLVGLVNHMRAEIIQLVRIFDRRPRFRQYASGIWI
jgi:hypothetical protein